MNSISNIILIVISVIAVISLFIWIFTSFKIFKTTNNSKNSSNISSIFIIVIVLIFIILLPIILIKSNVFENYDNSNTLQGHITQYGRSGIEPTGTITFQVPFQNTPKIFTQIIGNENTSTNVYSIQVFNVTNKGFNYSKNMINNSTSGSGQFTMPKLSPSTVEPFDWIAFG
jgi:hypothetical protein